MIFVVDNFYPNPDEIRVKALKAYSNSEKVSANNYPGIKILIEDEFIKNYLISKVSKIVNEKLILVESCFQFVNKSFVKGIPHDDRERKYTSIIYLNPNSPKNSGTEIFDHFYKTNSKLYTEEKFILPYKRKFFAAKKKNFLYKFLYSKLIDSILKDQKHCTSIANKYNRHLIFDSKMVHRAQNYFGEGKESRLCLVSFFH